MKWLENRYVPFMKQIKGYKQLLSPLTESIWTQNCQQNIKNQTIHSHDDCITLQLHQNQHKISISFPLYVDKKVTVTAHGSSLVFYNHIQQTQIQSIHHHDLCWDFALSLIRNQANATETHSTLNVMNRIALPSIQEHSLQKGIANLSQDCMKAIEYFHCLDHGIPPNQIIIIEWSLDIVHRVFNEPNYLIETFISFDDSYLISNEEKTFMYHYIPQNDNNASKYVYAVNAIPPIAPDTKQESSYKLNMIAKNALSLLENAFTQHSFKQTKTAKNVSLEYKKEQDEECETQSISNEVKHYYIHPKFGEFTYFQDKRVKIYFSDRAMMQLNSDWKTCSIITKYGEEIKNVDCMQAPQHFTHYIQHALNYANWCSLPKDQQIKHQQQQLKLQNDIKKQINFSQRLLDTQKMTQHQDYATLLPDDMLTNSNASGKSNMDNTSLIESIQDQLNDIDKLLQ